jgi:amino acid adenylation domain-containing protein
MPNDETIVSLFSKQALKTPENTALEFQTEKLSYKQLDEKSNQLADFLRKRGIGKETLVPICLNRSPEMIIAILGIIKAGGTYIPIDPDYPQERIAYILNDVKAEVIISNKQCSGKLSGEIILLDQEWELIGKSPRSVALPRVNPDDLMYIIYTSGSTGAPKGVMVEHQSLVAYIAAQTQYFNITADERVLQFSNYAFDASIEQTFLALLNGACLVLLNENLLKDAEAFSSFLKFKEITHLHSTPGFLENISPDDYPHLKRVISAGDICKKQLAANWVGKVDFYNKYGPTEGTISALEYHCPTSGIDDLKSLPIGKPVPGVAVYIVDEDFNVITQTGQRGEICIGGIQVARGYLNQPELSKQKFVSNPLNALERLYKTGDVAMYLEDGNIQFMGRNDDQVKIRGYRIELGEIENVLRAAPSVKQSLVIAEHNQESGMQLIAYVVTDKPLNKELIQKYLYSRLPEYMVPQLFVQLDAIPLTANGKVDRKALVIPDASSLLTSHFVAAKHATEKILAEHWKSVLNIKRVGVNDNFFELGGNSLLAQKLVSSLKSQKIQLPVTKLYSFPTISGIAAFLDGRTEQQFSTERRRRRLDDDEDGVAVVGMSARFPGANTISEFWDNLKNGKETISFFSAEELDPSISNALKNNPDYVKARGVIDSPAAFDPAFFGINLKLAELMDPQQRIFLEICWEALEGSGHIPGRYAGTIGVFAGCRFNTYYSNNVSSNRAHIENVGAFQVGTVTDKDYIATRVAYALDLRGPAVNVQSACSTSLLAIAQAADSIRNGQCDVALAGGASILVPINSGHLYEEGAILSRDGHCRTFDAAATGTIFSDGAGVVLLKNRKLAEQDGDTIYAIIKGTGLSNDGGSKGSFTAPSAMGQAHAIRMAIQDAGVNPSDISYIEAHGTATPIGDPIEIEGLNLAFGEQHAKQFCAIGSLKSNVGHMTAASGVAGLIKTCLALYHKQIPASINYDRSNPQIDFENGPFYVNSSLRDWTSDKKRIAGVSSFGVGGTNVHIIMEEAAVVPVKSGDSRPMQLLCWSAKDETSAITYGDKLAGFLNKQPEVNLADVAYTLNLARKDFKSRRFTLATNKADFANSPLFPTELKATTKTLKGQAPELVFMFPGQGAQFPGMGKDLYDSEPVFKAAMDEFAALFLLETGENILDIIYPSEINEASKKHLQNTKYSQPALFSIGYSLGKLWMSWGIYPGAFIGHSIGEFVAAYFAGVFSLPDAVKLIAARGKMMSELPGGSMLSVRASVEDIRPLLSSEVALAAVNSPNASVLAGSFESISALSKILDEKGMANRILATSHAFHSHMMDSIVAPFQALVSSISLNAPVIPILSTVTGDWMQSAEATNPAYWAGHLRSTVLFEKAIAKLFEASYSLFLEVGPGNTTAALTRQQSGKNPAVVLTSMGKDAQESSSYSALLNSLGQLWQNGLEPDWKTFYKDQERVQLRSLPTYAFNRKEYWINPIVQVAPDTTVLPLTDPVNTNESQPIPLITKPMRKQQLIEQLKEILENASGIELDDVPSDLSFIEMGLDSLLLTQVSFILKKKFAQPITFRQLNEEYGTLELLASYLDKVLPEESPVQATLVTAQAEHQRGSSSSNQQTPAMGHEPHPNGFAVLAHYAPVNGQGSNANAIDLISQQLHSLANQLALLQGAQLRQLPHFNGTSTAAETNHHHAAKANGNAEGDADPLNYKPIPNARLGKDRDGNPGWFIKDQNNPDKYLQVILETK